MFTDTYLNILAQGKVVCGPPQVAGHGLLHLPGGRFLVLVTLGGAVTRRVTRWRRRQLEDAPDVLTLGLDRCAHRVEGELLIISRLNNIIQF